MLYDEFILTFQHWLRQVWEVLVLYPGIATTVLVVLGSVLVLVSPTEDDDKDEVFMLGVVLVVLGLVGFVVLFMYLV